MKICINCNKTCSNLHGPMGNLCETCNNNIGHVYDPQISQEDYEQNLNKRGDTKWKK